MSRNCNRPVLEIILEHVAPKTFEVQSADKETRWQRIGFVVLHEQKTKKDFWFCKGADSLPLLVETGRLKVFETVFDAIDWLVNRHNVRTAGMEIPALTDR